jgi:hypothetical protein
VHDRHRDIYFDVIGMTKETFRASMTAILVALGVVRGLGYWAAWRSCSRAPDRERVAIGWPVRHGLA